MWKLIPRPLRRWLLFAVAVPVTAWLLDQAAEVIASRAARAGPPRSCASRASGWGATKPRSGYRSPMRNVQRVSAT